jgi:hypothetical protein
MTYNKMGIHLKKLWEVLGSNFEVKKVSLVLKTYLKDCQLKDVATK